jgi:hypothetical protein
MEAFAQDGEQSVNYLDKYSESVQELMNLTRNKRRFYQQGIQATPLFCLLDLFVTLPAPIEHIKMRGNVIF